jgi:hypothetical protein
MIKIESITAAFTWGTLIPFPPHEKYALAELFCLGNFISVLTE